MAPASVPTFPRRLRATRSRGIPPRRFAADALEPRLLLATISGQVWNDADGDGRQTVLERGLSGWTVYVDANNNGVRDTGELSAVTDASGDYIIDNATIRTGTFHVRTVVPPNWRPTAPDNGEQTVILLRLGDSAAGIDFGNTQRALVTGTVFHDISDDGAFDRGEPGLAGWTVFADANNNGALDAGETSATTDANGDYALSVPAGTYTIRQVTQAGWWQTAPAAGGGHAVTLSAAQTVAGRNFGDVVATIDLFGVGFAITSASQPAPADGRLDVFFQVRNTGTADAGGFRVAFYLSGDETITTADTLLRSVVSGPVPRHATQDRTTPVTLPTPDPFRSDNRYWVGMIVDEQNGVAETDEANNANRGALLDRYPVTSEADLPSPVDGDVVVARPLALGTGATSALGDEWIGPYDVDVFRFDAGVGHSMGVTLSAAEGLDIRYRLYGPTWAPVSHVEDVENVYVLPATGTYYVAVAGGNNVGANPRRLTGRSAGITGAYTLTVSDVGPDLGPPEIRVYTTTPTAPMRITYAVPASADVPDAPVGVYLSDDATITAADRLLATDTPSPGVGGEYRGTVDFELPAFDPFVTDNEYYIGVLRDPQDAIKERDETNNADAYPIHSENDLPSPVGSEGFPASLALGNPVERQIGDEWIGPYDQDLFTIDARANERLHFDIDGARTLRPLDSYIRLYDASWNLLASNDDAAAPGEDPGVDAYLAYTFTTAGEYHLVVGGSGNQANDPRQLAGRTAASTGPYTLTATNDPAGPVSGTLFDDVNANGVRDAGEPGLAGWTVYLGPPDTDLRPASPHPSAPTDASGAFVITGARAGSYGLRAVQPAGWLRTLPALEPSHPVTVGTGQAAGPLAMGFVRAASVSGVAFDDLDSDGARDSGEGPVQGRTVYLDLNNNGVRDLTTVSFPVTVDDIGDAVSRVRVPAGVLARVADVDVFVNSAIDTSVTYDVRKEAGTFVRLAADMGAPDRTTFDDEAPAQPTFQRRRPLNPLAAFDGAEAGGVWILSADFDGGFLFFGGDLQAWTLILTLSEPFAVTGADGSYTLADLPPGARHVRVEPQDPADWVPTAPEGGVHDVSLAPGEVQAGKDFGSHLRRLRVEGRHVFYNNSSFDGRNPTPSAADDAAVATDKAALLPGQTPTFANYTSYTRGINGIMLDVDELRGPLTAANFAFKVPSALDPSQWVAAPAPTGFDVRPLDAPDRRRVTFTWPDRAIRNTWLQVTVLADAVTRRLTPDVFYFGNLVGETGDRAVVTGRDVLAVRADLLSRSVPVTSRSDFDRDGRVTALDVVAARNNLRRALPAPVLPAPPAAAAPLTTTRASDLLKEE